MTFADFSTRWTHDYAEKQLKTKSVDWYKSMLDDRIIPAIGHLKLAKIQPHHLISFMTELQQRGVNRNFKYRAKDGLLEKVKEHKLTGSAIGVHPNTLRNAKLGRAVNAYTTKCIAQALGVREKDIFDIVGNDRGLSAQTITHYLRCISSVLSTAVEWQIITTNPCERVKAPKRDQHKIKFMEIDDAQKIIQKAMLVDDIRVKTAILLFVFT
ncbi:MAG: hypothetical protein GX173_10645 [Ruminococcaceae bacterium]|nr:hypothetical protein [Oscillospiraceae bacterium]